MTKTLNKKAKELCDKLLSKRTFVANGSEIVIYNKSSVLKNQTELALGFGAKYMRNVKHYDNVIVLVARVSSSQSSWCKFTNDSHGYVLIDCPVRVMDSGQRNLITNSEYDKFIAPIGKERSNQELNVFDYIVLDSYNPSSKTKRRNLK